MFANEMTEIIDHEPKHWASFVNVHNMGGGGKVI